MKKIEINNDLNLEVYINGLPKLSSIQPEHLSILITELELEICKMLDNRDKRRKYYKTTSKIELP